jgi:hypothetical protein
MILIDTPDQVFAEDTKNDSRYAGAWTIRSLNSVTNAPSFGPGLLRSRFARSKRTSCTSVPSTLIVSSMNSERN